MPWPLLLTAPPTAAPLDPGTCLSGVQLLVLAISCVVPLVKAPQWWSAATATAAKAAVAVAAATFPMSRDVCVTQFAVQIVCLALVM